MPTKISLDKCIGHQSSDFCVDAHGLIAFGRETGKFVVRNLNHKCLLLMLRSYRACFSTVYKRAGGMKRSIGPKNTQHFRVGWVDEPVRNVGCPPDHITLLRYKLFAIDFNSCLRN